MIPKGAWITNTGRKPDMEGDVLVYFRDGTFAVMPVDYPHWDFNEKKEYAGDIMAYWDASVSPATVKACAVYLDKEGNFKPASGECQTTKVPLNTQVGGNHYKNFKIQPAEFSEKNGLSFCEGNVIKYIARKKDNRLEDLKKARHYIDMLIQFEEEKRDV